jgi:AraC-like DNA-binding protein
MNAPRVQSSANSSDNAPIKFAPVRFCTANLNEARRLAAWREHYARTVLRVDIEPHTDTIFECALTSRTLPNLQVLLAQMSAVRVSRTPELVADGVDDYALIVNVAGTLAASGGGNHAVLTPGDAILMSGADVARFERHIRGGSLSIRVPRAVLAETVIDLDDLRMQRLPRETEALGLLARYTGAILDEELLGSAATRAKAIGHVHDLLALALGATADAAERSAIGGLPAARLRLAKHYIAQNSAQHGLAVPHVAKHLGLAERTVQQLFERDGTTFSAFVLGQRLARARRMLVDPKHDGIAVSTIAYEVGFGDLSYFNRSFKLRYGAPPHDVRNASRG